MIRKKWFIYIGLILAGTLAGYAYWYYIGCNSGTCPLTSSWKGSSFAGAIIGYMVSDMINKKQNDNKLNEINSHP